MSVKLRRKKGAGKRLAPLDVDGAQDTSDGPKIRVKADLARTVREVQVAHARSLSSIGSGSAANEAARNAMIKDLLPETNEGPSFEVLQLEESVNVNARRFNDLKMSADRKHAELDKLLDQLNDMHMEKQAIDMHVAAATPEAHRIERLKGEIQKVRNDMKKKAFYKAQLDHMMRRLVKNERKYDRHIGGMENALKASQKECREVHHLLRQLQAGKAEAFQKLTTTKQDIEQAKEAQAQGMGEREAQVAAAKQVEEWRQHMDEQRREMNASAMNDLGAADEERLRRQVEQEREFQEKQEQESREQAKEFTTLEDWFNKVRHSTGVKTPAEMVDKFMGQGKKAVALEAQKVAAEEKLKQAKAKLEAQTQQLVDLKATGVGGGSELNREEYDKVDEQILQVKAGLKVHSASCERLHAVLVAVRQGAVGLQQRLAPFKGLVEQHEEIAISSGGSGSGAMNGANGDGVGVACLDALRLVELKLGKMVEASMQPGNTTSFNDDDGADAAGEVDVVDLNVGRNNLRVRSVVAKRGDDDVAGDAVEDDEDVTMTYDKVKGIAARKMEIERRRLEAEAKKKRIEEMEDDEDGDARKASLRKRKMEQAAATKRLAEQHDKMDGLPIPGQDPMEVSTTFLTSVPDLA